MDNPPRLFGNLISFNIVCLHVFPLPCPQLTKAGQVCGCMLSEDTSRYFHQFMMVFDKKEKKEKKPKKLSQFLKVHISETPGAN